MFEKNLKIAYLMDFYGDILDDHTKTVMKQYYYDDLSLAEIADGVGISRQGVRHIIKKGEEQLEYLENGLHFAKSSQNVSIANEKLSSLLNQLDNTPDGKNEELKNSLKEIQNLLVGKTD